MATYQLTSPDGQKYQVTAPDDATQEQVYAYFKANYGKTAQPKGQDLGAANSALNGFNSAVPFGERIVAGIAAPLIAAGTEGRSMWNADDLSASYDQARNTQAVTNEANPTANALGAVAGLANSLPFAIETAGSRALAGSGGLKGLVNAIPQAATKLGNFAGAPIVAEGGSALTKFANLAGQGVKSAALAAPVNALYAAGAAKEGEQLDAAADGLILGAGVSAALPVAGGALGKLGRAVSPEIDKGLAGLARQAQDFGIDLRLDQISPSRFRKTVQKVSQELPFSGSDAFEKKQVDQWRRAVSRETIGQDDLSAKSIAEFKKQQTRDFDGVLKGKTINMNDLTGGLDNILADVPNNHGTDIQNIVKNNVDYLKQNILGDAVNGTKVSSVRSQLIKRASSADAQARPYISKMIEEIDNVIMPQVGDEAAGVLSKARRQYRDYKTLKPLLEKAGGSGEINPTQLIDKISSSRYVNADVAQLGDDPLIDLANIGKRFLPKAGGSDTIQKGLLFAGGASLLNPATAVPTIGGIAGNRAFQSFINTNQNLVSGAIDRSLGNKTNFLSQLSGKLSEIEGGANNLTKLYDRSKR